VSHESYDYSYHHTFQGSPNGDYNYYYSTLDGIEGKSWMQECIDNVCPEVKESERWIKL